MQTTEPHVRVGAYALGVLGSADTFRFEEHLALCPGCRLRAGEFAGVRDGLAVVGAPVVPGPGFVERLTDAVAAGRRRAARRRLALVAAAVVLSVGGPVAVAGLPGGPVEGAGPQRWSGTDASSGVAAVVTAAGREWGTAVALEVARLPVVGVCALVAVGRDGSEETVGSWSAGGVQGGPVEVSGGAALRPEGIDHFEVRTADGRRLVTVTR
ncbi:zf-HC2 domain-containing protein [Streptomyces sp. YPW6]|uniref:zf-HC2 domain-containing protein n=1 Tax=Streptomyces sp. YPW6 TaxID=2840373 RepID=UPI001C0AFAC0|nr:zf-HC2 domain-containing protein [Streptomyces sp. YPW6]QWQ39943.1 zf-HC2 domain-containing protein [Streptomyces sp. YPW6]